MLHSYRICLASPLRDTWLTIKAETENRARFMASLKCRKNEYVGEVVEQQIFNDAEGRN